MLDPFEANSSSETGTGEAHLKMKVSLKVLLGFAS
jgi:hypothetical protein